LSHGGGGKGRKGRGKTTETGSLEKVAGGPTVRGKRGREKILEN